MPVPVPEPVLLPLVPVLLPVPPMCPVLSFGLILQVSDSIFTSVTLKVPLDQLSLPEEPAVADEFEGEPLLSQVPFTLTSCPTCAETS